MIETILFLYRFDWIIIVRSLPATDAIFPSLVIELKVTGIIANELKSRFTTFSYVSGLLSKVRVDLSI
jgi:hypothetical protein